MQKNTSGAEPHWGQWPAHPAESGEKPYGTGPVLYVASRASLSERPAMWRDLRNKGWRICSTWIDEAGDGETGDFIDLWSRIENEVRSADGLILYAERDDFPLKGALIEVGMALGMRKPVAVVLGGAPFLEPRSLRPVGSWLYHPRVQLYGTVEEARSAIARTRQSISDIPRIQADIDRAHAEEVRLGMHDVGGVA